MLNRTDIAGADDIDRLVRAFYTRVRPDAVIGHFFTELDWDHHIPRIVSFWCMVLLGDRSYQGDPMTAHILLSRKQPMQAAHFAQWLMHWEATVDDLFEGAKAEEAKQRARTIASVMEHKVKGA
ncbi:MAG TPA: group III truncated hemoglobin [Flavobacteriales bacterium]|nr:group III truncated hemoglobin [Flavobacteriales bacterium]